VVVAKARAPKPVVPIVDVQATQHYLAALASRIDRSKFYPRASRRLGEEGIAVVGFVIRRDGELTDIHIVESSGHRRLDEAALKTLRRATPFERIPDAIDREQWPITVPIAFSLRG
jgi:protein TonB